MKSKGLWLKAKHGEKDVELGVTDLDGFIHAGPDDFVLVASDDDEGHEHLYEVKKRDLHHFAVDE